MPAATREGYGLAAWIPVAVACAWLLTGCGFFAEKAAPPPPTPIRAPSAKVPPASYGEEAYSSYGNPEFYEVMGRRYYPLKSAEGYVQRGIASWYGPDFHGRLTSSREIYDMYQMTGAHRELPLPTYVEVTNLENRRKVILRVNDRGPFKDNRVIDLSYAAALTLDVVAKGTAFVELRAVTRRQPATRMAAAPARQRMYLQIGAFSNRANAERLLGRIGAQIAEQVRIYEEYAVAPRLYKVQVGPIADVDHADRLVAALAQIGISDHHFVGN